MKKIFARIASSLREQVAAAFGDRICQSARHHRHADLPDISDRFRQRHTEHPIWSENTRLEWTVAADQNDGDACSDVCVNASSGGIHMNSVGRARPPSTFRGRGSSNDSHWYPGRKVSDATAFQATKLEVVGNRRAFLTVVCPAQCLPILNTGPAASRVRVDVVGFEILGDPTSTDEAVVFATLAGSVEDERAVGATEPAVGIFGSGVDRDSHRLGKGRDEDRDNDGRESGVVAGEVRHVAPHTVHDLPTVDRRDAGRRR